MTGHSCVKSCLQYVNHSQTKKVNGITLNPVKNLDFQFGN